MCGTSNPFWADRSGAQQSTERCNLLCPSACLPWQSYCDALNKVAEEYADEVSQLVPQFGLLNIVNHFRTMQRYERILPRALVEAIRSKVQPLI